MAVTYKYNDTNRTIDAIYLATGGGVVFSANRAGSATMDYFDDASVVDDAIYFGDGTTYSDLLFNVGTQLVADAITVAWEYYDDDTEAWIAVEQLTDNTTAFTIAGANTVVFPYQYNWKYMSVNSVTKFWIRVRITAVTNITEGGANQTTAPYGKDGIIRIEDSAIDDMGNLPDLLTWMDANHPEVEMEQMSFWDSAYIIPRTTIYTSSGNYFELDYEVLFLQHQDIRTYLGMHTCYGWYLTDSVLVTKGISSANYRVLSSYVMIRSQLYPGGCRFHGGTLTDVNILSVGSLRSFQGGGTITRTYIPSFLSLGTLSATIDNSEFGATVLWYGSTFSPAKSRFNEPAIRHEIVGTTVANSINFIDPETLMPELDTGDFITRRFDTLSVNKCWFYDDSAGTYTDYTTAAQNDTVDDVPLSGDVGDILYIGCTHAFWAYNHTRGQGLKVTIGEANTDYVYIYEMWNGSAWATLDMSEAVLTSWGSYNGYDATKQMSQSGLMVFRGATGTGSTTVNGQTAYWLRIRIATKGTGTPSATRFYPRGDTAIGMWHCYEKYNLDLKVVDDTNTAIIGATVQIIDSDGVQQFSDVTDGSGDIAQQTLILKDVYFDPFNEDSLPTYSKQVQKTFGDYTVTISKAGYISRELEYIMNQKRVEVEMLEDIVDFIVPMGDKIYMNLDPTNSQNKLKWQKV